MKKAVHQKRDILIKSTFCKYVIYLPSSVGTNYKLYSSTTCSSKSHITSTVKRSIQTTAQRTFYKLLLKCKCCMCVRTNQD